MAAAFDPAAYTEDAKQNWSKAAASYSRLSADYFPPITAAFVDFCGPLAGQTVLDVACGPGTLTHAAAKVVGPFGKIIGVDLSAAMIKIAAAQVATTSVEFREMNAEQLDFPDEIFTRVVCQLGLMLFAQPNVALREMARVCKSGGTVSCLVQGDPDRMLFTSLVMKSMFKHAPELKQPGAPGIYAFAPAGVLEAALTQAGLVNPQSRRLTGAFQFSSPEHYWETLTDSAGRTAALLQTLSGDKQAAIKAEVLAAARSLTLDGKTDIPYEVVMAKAVKA